jgi:predicted transcriptional regulator
MSFVANVLKVMIASPGDVQQERRIVTEELYQWNNANAVARRLVLQPVKWETHSAPDTGAPAQTLINADLVDDSDILVGIFGNRIGSPTEKHPSGTVEEIKTHVAAGKRAMVYFSRVPVDPTTVDYEQLKAVQAFQEECKTFGMYSEYKSYDDFRSTFSHHLDITLNKPEFAWLSRNLDDALETAVAPPLSNDAKRLLLEAAHDSAGNILASTHGPGLHLQVNNETLCDYSPRAAAHWKRILKDLEGRGLIEARGNEMYDLTDEGFAEADVIEHEATEETAKSALSPEAKQILEWADERGSITILKTGAHHEMIVAGTQQLPVNSARDLATWNAALDELAGRGFIERKSQALYQVTKLGYEQLDLLRPKQV